MGSLLRADELVVNVATTSSATNETTFSITNGTVSTTSVAVFTTTMYFTIPSENPNYADFASEKLVIVPDTTGQLLIANGKTGTWLETGIKIVEGPPTTISARAVTSGDKMTFTVSIGEKTFEIDAPSNGATFTNLTFEGEGTAEGIALSIAPKAFVSGNASTSSDASFVQNYTTWLNDADKGGSDALKNVSEDEMADAFAMNTGAKPKLEITSIDSENKTITVKGSYGEGVVADLDKINGTLFITYAEGLSGEATVKAVDFTTDNQGVATVELPGGAKFVKATVAMKEPEKKL
jgi:hypothetical protein